ncbi:MAG: hypothetical protein AVO33_06670 [delta proteobacterium ML8_F1]|nr:MAG: hypothetical protein AVO33_06670 [delta proteobacterium ML8_F1]
MERFSDLLRSFDLDKFGSGNHKISFEQMMALKKENKAMVVDVRTKQEYECVKLKFAVNIPTDEIPDRIHEIPMDQTVVLFCSSATRATIVYAYLLLMGYGDVKILNHTLGEVAEYFKPGYVQKNYTNLVDNR